MSRPSRYLTLLLVGATIGLLFASVSTRDFAMHLDREVHDVTCSFTPGLSGPEIGESGCLVTMISPYSSVLRGWVWGGVPIALPAMAVFAFLLALGVELVLSGRQHGRRATGLLALVSAVPLAASMVMAGISIFEIGAVCKLCVGIYVASALCFAGGLGAWLEARRGGVPAAATRPPAPAFDDDDGADPAFLGGRPAAAPAPEPPPDTEPARVAAPDADDRSLIVAVAAGFLFVAVPVALYGALAPDHSELIGTCGSLAEAEGAGDVMVPLGGGEVPAVEILDPLCPACAQFEERLEHGGHSEVLARQALLFPLDDTCNWMVDEAVHPGACSISEAILCAGDGAAEVLAWSFASQERILAAERAEVGAAARMVAEAFPEVASCIGSAKVKARLNRALRWAVANRIQVKTPQLFVGGVKLCDEDVDLGLSYMLSRMIERHRAGTLAAVGDGEAAVDDTAVDEAATTATEPADTTAAPEAATAPNTEAANTPPDTAADVEATKTAPEADPAKTAPESEPAKSAPKAEPVKSAPETRPTKPEASTEPELDGELEVPEPGSDSGDPPPAEVDPAGKATRDTAPDGTAADEPAPEETASDDTAPGKDTP